VAHRAASVVRAYEHIGATPTLSEPADRVGIASETSRLN